MSIGWHDIRQAARRLATNPTVTIPAVFSLALAVGANGAIFGVVKGLLIDPLPFADSHQLVRMWGLYPQSPDGRYSLSYPNYEDVATAPALESATAYQSESYTLGGDDGAERVGAVAATGTLFHVLGVAPELGRVFGPEAAGAGGERVVVLSHRLWQDRFGKAVDIVGTSVLLDGTPYTVIGVMPEGFSFPIESGEVWVPLLEDGSTWHRNRGGLTVVGRLAPGADMERLAAQLRVIAGRISQDYPAVYTDWSIGMGRLPDVIYGPDVRLTLFTLLAAVVLLLGIAGINISNLLLARSTARRQELAVRAALGADRGRVVQLFLLDSAVLGAVGGVLGLGVAQGGIGVLRRLAPAGIARSDALVLDPWIMAATLVLALLAGFALGVLPALNALHTGPAAALAGSGRARTEGIRGRRAQRVLVAAQVALVLVVLTGAGLLLRSARALHAVDPGFRADGAVAASVSLTADYDRTNEVAGFADRVLETLRSQSGVEAAGLVFNLPLADDNNISDMAVEDSDNALEGFQNEASVNYAGPGYFRAMGIPVVEGRTFEATDGAGTQPVIILSAALARRFWPESGAVGKRVAVPGEEGQATVWRTVVGVVGSTHHTGLREEPRAEWYIPWNQLGPNRIGYARRYLTFVVRAPNPAAMAEPIRQAVAAADPGQAAYGIQTLQSIVDDQLGLTRGLAMLLTLFGGIALVLASVGVFGVVSHAVTQRRREIGIRAALGAARARLLRQVVVQGLVPVAAGIAVGVVVAAFGADALASILFHIEPRDAITFVTVPLVLLVVALAAVFVPAWRAARVNPVEALRVE